MSDVDIAAFAAAASMLADDSPDDKAIRKWFEGLPKDTQARLVPLNPKIAESLMRTGRDIRPAEYVAAARAWPSAAARPEDGHAYDGWAHDSFCVQCRRSEREHHPPRPPKPRPRAPLVMLFALAITFVGLIVQFPGTCLVVVGRTLMSWAEGWPAEEDE